MVILSRRHRFIASLSALPLVLLGASVASAQAPPASAGSASGSSPSLVVVTVGGGPEPPHNQVAIESNVRYVDTLLPVGTPRTILFGDGKTDSAIVQYIAPPESNGTSPSEKALRMIFGQAPEPGQLKYRAPQITAIDGPSQRKSVGDVFDRLASGATAAAPSPSAFPYLLYFTGHGDRNRQDMDNNAFALWREEKGLSVRDLATEVAKLPADHPVVLVMVQCFSGAFGNLLFAEGNPTGEPLDRPICGFFASTRERVAAGCTPEVNEAEYHDFTSYFFAALSGRDRLGRSLAPPDYNKDGKVGMNEAFAYAIIAEPSIDVPVATSDVFLRRYVPLQDSELETIPFETILAQASPAQRAALDGISKALKETGPDRLKNALRDVRASLGGGSGGGAPQGGGEGDTEIRQARQSLTQWRRTLEAQFPALAKGPRDKDFPDARKNALKYLEQHPDTVKEILKAQPVLAREGDRSFSRDIRAARCLRLLRVAKSVVLEQRLRTSGKADLIARFDRLQALEAQNPLQKMSIAAPKRQVASQL